jgi:hypothetical protein
MCRRHRGSDIAEQGLKIPRQNAGAGYENIVMAAAA